MQGDAGDQRTDRTTAGRPGGENPPIPQFRNVQEVPPIAQNSTLAPPPGPGPGWRSRWAREVYRNRWIALEEHAVTAPTGAPAAYGVVRFQNLAIAILPLFPDGSTVLVGQHRFPRMNYSWEVPEGGSPVGVDPLIGARRELKEETGLEAATWITAFEGVELSNSVTDEQAYGYIALELTEGDPEPDPTEQLALRRMHFREALALAAEGTLKDVLTVAMLYRVHHMAVEGALPPALAAQLLRRESP